MQDVFYHLNLERDDATSLRYKRVSRECHSASSERGLFQGLQRSAAELYPSEATENVDQRPISAAHKAAEILIGLGHLPNTWAPKQ